MTSETPSAAMAARYGLRQRSRTMIIGITALVLAFGSTIGYVTWRMATPPVQTTLLAFLVVNDSRIDITFEIHRDEASDTICVLRAQAENHTDVGYATVTITRGRTYVQPTYRLATRAQATSGEVLGCAANELPRVDAAAFPPGTANPPQARTIDGT